jgi:sulfite reductase beta subunit-like hemoprotein
LKTLSLEKHQTIKKAKLINRLSKKINQELNAEIEKRQWLERQKYKGSLFQGKTQKCFLRVSTLRLDLLASMQARHNPESALSKK